MSLRSPTENESREFPGHDFPSVVIPAHAGIQVCSRPVSLDTRLRGYDGTPPLAPLAAIIPHRTFEGGHEEPRAAKPQPNLGISPAKHVLSDAEGTRRPQSSEFCNESHSKVTIFFFKTWRLCALAGEFPNPSVFSFRIICAGRANFEV